MANGKARIEGSAGLRYFYALCQPINAGDSHAEELLRRMLAKGVGELERATGRIFGDARLPLLVSVRSGAARSMPGMLDTILNTGMTVKSVHGLIRLTGNPRLAWDSYRRFVQAYTEVTGNKGGEVFAARLAAAMRAEGIESEAELDPEVLERVRQVFSMRRRTCWASPSPRTPMSSSKRRPKPSTVLGRAKSAPYSRR